MNRVIPKFGPTSNVDEVLQGQDLKGSRLLITGASAGVGFEMASALARRGAEVVGAVRDPDKALSAFERTGINGAPAGKIRLERLDLASLASVRGCADGLLKRDERFDVIIGNAGVMAVAEGSTVDGFETQFAINYLGHFVLVNRCAGLLKPSGRLVMVSSAGHRGADVDLDDINFQSSAYDPLVAYRRSKTATILFAVEFDRRHKGRNVRATAVHPGAVLTDTTRKLIEAQPSAASAFTWKTVAQGAATPVWASFVAEASQIGAHYCEDCGVAEIVDDPSATRGVRSYALNPERAQALWRKSESIVGETF